MMSTKLKLWFHYRKHPDAHDFKMMKSYTLASFSRVFSSYLTNDSVEQHDGNPPQVIVFMIT